MSTAGRDCCIFCGTDANISTRIENDKSRSLHVISILHKLLQIPIYECGKYLDFTPSSSSSSGTDWLILCASCSLMVAQGHTIALQLDLLHDQLAKIRTTLRTQIVNGANSRTDASAEIFDQLKQDVLRRRDTDNMDIPPVRFSDPVNFPPPPDNQGSSDDINFELFGEEIKIEEPELNLGDDYDLNIDPLTMEIDDAAAEPNERRDDEVHTSEANLPDKGDVVRKPKEAKVAKMKTTKNTTTPKKLTRIKKSAALSTTHFATTEHSNATSRSVINLMNIRKPRSATVAKQKITGNTTTPKKITRNTKCKTTANCSTTPLANTEHRNATLKSDKNGDARKVRKLKNSTVSETPRRTRTPKKPIEYNPLADFSTASIQLFETLRGKPRLQVNGYFYNFAKFGTNKRIWSCERLRSYKCHARLHTSHSSLDILGELGTHIHGPLDLINARNETVSKIEDASTNEMAAIDSTSSYFNI